MVNENLKEITSLVLGTVLVFALLPENHKKAKMHMTLVWLIYSMIYQDYTIMTICVVLLALNL